MSDHAKMLDHLERLRREELRIQQTIAHEVAVARFTGLTWEQVGTALGISKQAAHQRFHTSED